MRQHIHGGKPFVIAKNVSPKEWEMTLNHYCPVKAGKSVFEIVET